MLESTAFDYIVSKVLENKHQLKFCSVVKRIQDKIQGNFEKFFEIENVHDEMKPLNLKDQYCESHFLKKVLLQ